MNLSVIWRLQDMMTPVMNRVSKTARSAQDVVERANVLMSRGFKTSANSVDGLREKIQTLTKYRDGLRIGIDGSEIRKANTELNMLQTKLDKVTNFKPKGTGMAGAFGGLRGMAVGYGLYEAVGAGQDALNRGMEMGAAQAKFRLFIDNKKKADELLGQIKAYSDKYSIYSRQDLMQNASQISFSYGKDKIMYITNMVAKLAMGDKQNQGLILKALTQIKGTGYLQGDELNQLLNAGVYGVQEKIAQMKKITSQQFNKMKESQLISYQDVENALGALTAKGGAYNKILDTVMNTAYGKWNSIKAKVGNKITEIGMSASNSLSKAFDWILRFGEMSAPIGTAFGRLGVAFKPLLNGFFKIAEGLGLVSKKGDSVTKTVDFISNVINRLAWVINVVGKAVDWIGSMFVKYPWLKYALGFLAISYALGAVKDKISNLSNIFVIGELLSKLPFANIANGFSMIARAMQLLWASSLGPYVLGAIALGAAIYYAWQKSETFRKVIITIWEALKALWNDGVTWVSEWYTKVSNYINLFRNLWNAVLMYIHALANYVYIRVATFFGKVMDPFNKAIDSTKEKLKGLYDWFEKKQKWATGIVGAAAGKGGKDPIANALFGNKYLETGKKIAESYEVTRRAQEKQGKKTGKKAGFAADFFAGNIPGLAGKLGGAGQGGAGGKTPGITDTVNGAVSKQITINLNSKIADINNYFIGNDGEESMSKKISDQVLMELNRILMTGDRLALE